MDSKGEDGSKFSIRVLNILVYLENAHPTENPIISRIVQETCSDSLISKEGPETSFVFLIANKGSCTLFYSI